MFKPTRNNHCSFFAISQLITMERSCDNFSHYWGFYTIILIWQYHFYTSKNCKGIYAVFLQFPQKNWATHLHTLISHAMPGSLASIYILRTIEEIECILFIAYVRFWVTKWKTEIEMWGCLLYRISDMTKCNDLYRKYSHISRLCVKADFVWRHLNTIQ